MDVHVVLGAGEPMGIFTDPQKAQDLFIKVIGTRNAMGLYEEFPVSVATWPMDADMTTTDIREQIRESVES